MQPIEAKHYFTLVLLVFHECMFSGWDEVSTLGINSTVRYSRHHLKLFELEYLSHDIDFEEINDATNLQPDEIKCLKVDSSVT